MTTARDLIVFYAVYKRSKEGLTWYTRNAEYFWSPSGRPLRHDNVTKNLVEYNDHMAAIVYSKTRALEQGGDLARWQASMADIIKDNHRVSYMAGRGGKEAMELRDWGSVGGDIRFELNRLDNFAAEIASGRLTPAQIQMRSEMYVRASHTAYQKGYNAGKRNAGFTEERRVSVNDDKVCKECAEYAAAGWRPIGTLPAPGDDCSCKSNCRCEYEFRRDDEVVTEDAIAFGADKEAADAWADEFYGDPGWYGGQREALNNYQATAYRSINQYLRGQVPEENREWFADRYDFDIELIQSAIDNAKPLESAVTVYRGVSQRMFDEYTGDIIGMTFRDDGFSSTSLFENIAANAAGHSGFLTSTEPILLEITLPAGTRAAPMMMAGGSMASAEAELLLSAGSTFKVVGETVREVNDLSVIKDYRIIKMLLIP